MRGGGTVLCKVYVLLAVDGRWKLFYGLSSFRKTALAFKSISEYVR